MTTFKEPNYLSDLVKWEAESRYSREEVIVLAGSGAPRSLALGAVIGRQAEADAVTVTAGQGNAGNGAAGPVTLGAEALVGSYVLTCVKVAAGGGAFSVNAPSGDRLKDLKVGTAYASTHLNLTLAAGAVDFALDDAFTVTVAKGSGKVTAIDLGADDGRQVAYGVLIQATEAPDGTDAAGLAIVRQALVAPSFLVWPEGATEDQKTAALAQLAAKGILTRKEA